MYSFSCVSTSNNEHAARGSSTGSALLQPLHNEMFATSRPELARAETVAINSEGILFGVAQGNTLRQAVHARKRTQLLEESLHLGPGQGLALDFDATGDLIICVAGAVSP